jgi:DHA3 family tetracycline resistance protein-like MFS transporter
LNLRKWDAYRVYLVRSGLESLASGIVFTTWMVFQIQVAHMTALELVLAGTALEVAIFLFEIPTGIVADVYSRRLSVIIGIFIIGLAFIVQGLIPTAATILLMSALWGIGYTFTSGASDAWIVDEVGDERAGQVFLRGSQVGRLLGIPGIILSVALASIDLRLPVLVGGAMYLALGLFMLAFMPETGFTPRPRQDRSTFGHMLATFRDGARVVRRSPALLSILAIGLFIGLYSEAWDRLWQLHLITNFTLPWFTPVVWFGIIDIALMLLGIAAAEFVRRRVNMSRQANVKRALWWMLAFMVGGLVAFGLTQSLLVALAAMFIFSLMRGLTGPLFATWSNQNIASDVRATVLSMQSQVDAIGQMAGGPPRGAVGQLSLRAAFLCSAAILAPTLYLLRRAGPPTAQLEIEPAEA